MNVDLYFRLIFAAIVAVFLPFGLYHRIRSHTGERLDRWQEGVFILFGLRLSGVPWVIGGIVWMINPQWMAWSTLPIPIWMRWCGFIFIGCGMILFAWTLRTLGKNLTDTVVTRKEHTLVTTGPYRYVRHPFYSTIPLAVVGGSLVTANWFLLVAGLIPFAFLVARSRIEEDKLIERFGDEYREYAAKTGKLFPRLR